MRRFAMVVRTMCLLAVIMGELARTRRASSSPRG